MVVVAMHGNTLGQPPNMPIPHQSVDAIPFHDWRYRRTAEIIPLDIGTDGNRIGTVSIMPIYDRRAEIVPPTSRQRCRIAEGVPLTSSADGIT